MRRSPRRWAVSPKQAKALIHRAKKSFRRAWDQGSERRGVARAWRRSSCSLRPGCPGSSARILQPAHDVVASASATAQQAALQVTAAPVAVQSAISMTDKVTAAAITVIVAGTVSVGRRRHPAHTEALEADPGHLVARARAGRSGGRPRTRGDEAAGQAPPRAPSQARWADAGRGGSPPGPCPSRRRPSRRRPAEPSPTPRAASPAPPPGARVDAVRSRRPVASRRRDLALVSQRVTGQRATKCSSARSCAGTWRTRTATSVGTRVPRLRRLDRWARAGSLSSLWLWIDTPRGSTSTRRRGNLRAATEADDGSTTYVFGGEFSLSRRPRHARFTGPARRDHLDLAGVLGRRLAVRDQRLHGRILSQNTPAHEQP